MKIFSEQWLWKLLVLYVSLNLVTVDVLTQTQWAFGVARESYATQRDIVLYTGGEFWLIVVFSTTVVGVSMSVHHTHDDDHPHQGPPLPGVCTSGEKLQSVY